MAALKSLFTRKTKVPKQGNQRGRDIKSGEEFKILVMGHGGVGKSALVVKYVTDEFPDSYDPTIEDSYRKAESIDETGCTLDILDTAGQEEFATMRDQWIRESKVYVLVYSVGTFYTLDKLHHFSDQILRIREDMKDDVAVLFVANKIDLPLSTHEISFDDGKKAALKFSKDSGVRTSFMQASAKETINIKEIFVEAVNLLCGGPGNLNLIEPLDLSTIAIERTDKKDDTTVTVDSSATKTTIKSPKTTTESTAAAESSAAAGATSASSAPDMSLYVLKSDFDRMAGELAETRRELSELKSMLKQKQLI